MSKKKVNIRDVAAACGYSIYTVSLVLNGKPGVSDATRAKVQQTIRDIGYDPLKNMPLAKSLSAKTVGLVLPSAGCDGHRFFYRAISQTRSFASEHRWDIKIFTESDLHTRINENMLNSRSMGFDSLIVFCCDPPGDCIKRLLSQSIPVAMIRRDMDIKGILKVHDNDFQAISLAIEHLHRVHGHTKIALGGTQFQSPTAIVRKNAYLQYGIENNLDMNEEIIFESEVFGSQTHTAIIEKFRAGKFTAMLYIDDESAVKIAKFLLSSGVRIPEDLALIGYNNDPTADMFYPGISSVNVPVEEMINAACNTLLHNQHQEQLTSMEISFENSLVIRQSCGCSGKGVNIIT